MTTYRGHNGRLPRWSGVWIGILSGCVVMTGVFVVLALVSNAAWAWTMAALNVGVATWIVRDSSPRRVRKGSFQWATQPRIFLRPLRVCPAALKKTASTPHADRDDASVLSE